MVWSTMTPCYYDGGCYSYEHNIMLTPMMVTSRSSQVLTMRIVAYGVQDDVVHLYQTSVFGLLTHKMTSIAANDPRVTFNVSICLPKREQSFQLAFLGDRGTTGGSSISFDQILSSEADCVVVMETGWFRVKENVMMWSVCLQCCQQNITRYIKRRYINYTVMSLRRWGYCVSV